MSDDRNGDGPVAAEASGTPARFVPSGTLYELRGVERRYMRGSTPVLALHDVDLDIQPGEFVSMEGPSGSGKSTLLQLLGALDTPTSGTIRFEGNEMGSASDSSLTRIRSQEIGFVFQQFNLIPTLTAAENVGIAMIPHGPPKTERRQRSADLLERVGLGGRLDHLPSRLSGGEQRARRHRPSLGQPTSRHHRRRAHREPRFGQCPGGHVVAQRAAIGRRGRHDRRGHPRHRCGQPSGAAHPPA